MRHSNNGGDGHQLDFYYYYTIFIDIIYIFLIFWELVTFLFLSFAWVLAIFLFLHSLFDINLFITSLFLLTLYHTSDMSNNGRISIYLFCIFNGELQIDFVNVIIMVYLYCNNFIFYN